MRLKFALGLADLVVVWSNRDDEAAARRQGESYALLTDLTTQRRIHKWVLLQRTVGPRRDPASLDEPHLAYFTIQAVLREMRGSAPIDFAGVDEDGKHLTMMPVPEADFLS